MIFEHGLAKMGGREFELMCLTARVEQNGAQAGAVASLVAEGLSWPAFLAGVERNYVAPLVYRNLSSIPQPAVPAKVLDTLRVRSKITAIKCEKFAAELIRLARLLESKSIDVIHYKGGVTAAEYYGAVTLRTFNDLDFLVRRTELAAVCEILESEGYRMSEKLSPQQFEHHVAHFKEFLYQRGDICLEPHWSLAGERYSFDTDYEGFWERSRHMTLNGKQLRVMSAEDSLLVLCLVGAKGRWKRLQMVTDVAACIRNSPNIDWERVRALAEQTGTVRILDLGLLLAAELVGARLPESLIQRIREAKWPRRLAVEVVEALATAPRPSKFLPQSPSIFSLQLFRQRERYRDRWHYLWCTTTTPEQVHLQRFPLPKIGFPLYRVLVPFHDFVMYPAWQLGKALTRRG